MRRFAVLWLLLSASALPAELVVRGKTSQVVTELPFFIVAPEGAHFYNWTFPPAWKTMSGEGKDKNKVTVMEAPDGKASVVCKTDTIDFKAETTNSTVERLEVEVRTGKGALPPPSPTPAPTPTLGPVEVLIVYDDNAKYSPQIESVIFGARVRTYLRTKTGADPTPGPGYDGKAYRIWPKSVDASRTGPLWAALMSRPRASLPWIAISRGGAVLYEDALPTTVDAALALLQKYGG